MSAVASLLSIALFLAFATSGAQKLVFNPMTSLTAERLGFSKAAFQRLGLVELVGSVVLLVSVAPRHGSFLMWCNAGAGAALAVVVAGAVIVHLRRRDRFTHLAPALGVLVAVVLEVIFRLA